MVTLVQDILKKYHSSSSTICSFNCDCAQLGALMKGLSKYGIFQPPAPPFNGLSISTLSANLQNMSFPPPYNCSYGRSSQSHILRSLQDTIKELEGKITSIPLKAAATETATATATAM